MTKKHQRFQYHVILILSCGHLGHYMLSHVQGYSFVLYKKKRNKTPKRGVNEFHALILVHITILGFIVESSCFP